MHQACHVVALNFLLGSVPLPVDVADEGEVAGEEHVPFVLPQQNLDDTE